jgi:hypothetical protein
VVSGQPEQWVTLEEIWDVGAMLECEIEIELGVSAMISADDISFVGRITAVKKHEFGVQAEMTFSPTSRWTIEQWRPKHALDPKALGL